MWRAKALVYVVVGILYGLAMFDLVRPREPLPVMWFTVLLYAIAIFWYVLVVFAAGRAVLAVGRHVRQGWHRLRGGRS